MLYVVRYLVLAETGRRESFVVSPDLLGARKYYQAALPRIGTNGPILACAIYEADAKEPQAAIEAVKLRNARLVDAGGESRTDDLGPSLYEMISKNWGASVSTAVGPGEPKRNLPPAEDDAEILRRRIGSYRKYLAENTNEAVANRFRRLIAIAEAELAMLETGREVSDTAPVEC